MKEPTNTLPGALAAEIARVSEVREQYREVQRLVPQSHCHFAIANLTASLDAAIKAAGSPDIVAQMNALADLRDCS